MIKNNLKKLTLGSLIVFVLCVIVFLNYHYTTRYYLTPYEYIRKGDKENMYKRIVSISNTLDSLAFHELIDNLINDANKDLLSVEIASQYVYENEICSFIEQIEKEYNYLKSLPADTIWEVQIKRNYYRESGLKNSTVMRNLPRYLEDLKEHCE